MISSGYKSDITMISQCNQNIDFITFIHFFIIYWDN